MARLIAKYQNIYLFLITLSIISFIIGYFYYQVQDTNIKEEIVSTIDINHTLSTGFNNTTKRLKVSFNIIVNAILIVTIIKNITLSFTSPFEIGFIYNILKNYGFKFRIIYIGLYYIIPYLFTLILIRISISITVTIIKLIVYKKKKLILYLKKQMIKYLIIVIILMIYELILSIFSYNINLYLMAIIASI